MNATLVAVLWACSVAATPASGQQEVLVLLAPHLCEAEPKGELAAIEDAVRGILADAGFEPRIVVSEEGKAALGKKTVLVLQSSLLCEGSADGSQTVSLSLSAASVATGENVANAVNATKAEGPARAGAARRLLVQELKGLMTQLKRAADGAGPLSVAVTVRLLREPRYSAATEAARELAKLSGLESVDSPRYSAGTATFMLRLENAAAFETLAKRLSRDGVKLAGRKVARASAGRQTLELDLE